ncbi:YitT family protein [Hydrogenoanaerobacterium sp.]|uniref:YczE/YyaS/YitT family protein n=1 Tax=Hydrogenoanaerobacterium sp. TaxID=2953763 RepID=UPI00289DD166|nr:YitT family protein [Hydrogenoanaerobacterium sp.]
MNKFSPESRFPKNKNDLKNKTIKFTKDTIVITLGLMISALGTALFYAAELGSSPMATFCDGLHNILGISYGAANTLANLLLLFVLFLVERSYINVGTVLCVFVIGPFVNLFTPLLIGFNIGKWSLLLKILCTAAGTALMGIGLGLYVAVDRGFGALEGLVKFFCAKKGVSYTKAKIIQDLILVIGGIALSARWGIGTVVAIFLTGPVLQASIQFFSKRLASSSHPQAVK